MARPPNEPTNMFPVAFAGWSGDEPKPVAQIHSTPPPRHGPTSAARRTARSKHARPRAQTASPPPGTGSTRASPAATREMAPTILEVQVRRVPSDPELATEPRRRERPEVDEERSAQEGSAAAVGAGAATQRARSTAGVPVRAWRARGVRFAPGFASGLAASATMSAAASPTARQDSPVRLRVLVAPEAETVTSA